MDDYYPDRWEVKEPAPPRDVYLVKSFATASVSAVTSELNKLYREGWRLTYVVGDRHYFERRAAGIPL